MGLVFFSTTFDAYKTVSEIERILVMHGAKSIMKQYEGEEITSLSFLITVEGRDIPIKLPVRIDEVNLVLTEQKKAHPKAGIKATRDQANRVAWRIMKDWVEVQMALLDMKMVRFEEVFLSYIETTNGETIYDKLQKQQFLLNS